MLPQGSRHVNANLGTYQSRIVDVTVKDTPAMCCAAWAVRQKFFLGFKQRAMMLNMLCKSLEWIHVDNCFYRHDK